MGSGKFKRAYEVFCQGLLEDLSAVTATKPIAVSTVLHNTFASLQKPIYKTIVALATRFEEFSDYTAYPEGVERILQLWKDVPFHPGSYRTDYVLDENNHPWLIEITNRMALNGFFLNGVFHQATRAYQAQHNQINLATEFEGFIDYFIDLLNGKTNVVFLVGEYKGNESWYLMQLFPTIGINCEEVYVEAIPEHLELMQNALVISELGLNEIISLDDETLSAMREMQIVNDFRSTLIAHDKHFFSLLSNARFLRSVLSEYEAQLIEKFCAPTVDFPSVGSHLHNEMCYNKDQWIVKHRALGKGQSIHAGVEYSDIDWRQLLQRLEPTSFIAQRMITQQPHLVVLPDSTIKGYLSGTILYFNRRYFGPGMYRVSTQRVMGTGQRVKAPVFIQSALEGPMIQAKKPWSLLTASEQKKLIRDISRIVDSNGFAYVEGLATPDCTETECTATVLDMSHALGTPMPHDNNGQQVWRIAVKQEISLVPTFSQHAGEAGLHTDSQYRQIPEEAFALFTVSQASCGGGDSWILHHDDIVDALLSMPDGEKHYNLLKTTPVPFAVPSIFNTDETNDGHIEVILAPIFESDTIRYRKDTLAAGLKQHPIENESVLQALEALEKAIHENPNTTILNAHNGSCFFIDNKRTLHGRSEFSDTKRLMLRCRFNLKPYRALE